MNRVASSMDECGNCGPALAVPVIEGNNNAGSGPTNQKRPGSCRRYTHNPVLA